MMTVLELTGKAEDPQDQIEVAKEWKGTQCLCLIWLSEPENDIVLYQNQTYQGSRNKLSEKTKQKEREKGIASIKLASKQN